MPLSSIDLLYLIDDDLVFQAITKRMVNIYQFAKRTESFYNGLTAIRALGQKIVENEELPDVIFLDINVPIMDGWEFLHAFEYLPKPPKQILIYIVSSSDLEVDLDKARTFPIIEGFIVKPISEEDFALVWENFYMKRRLR